ncbi:MAG: hypothetical protein C5B50_12190 [Verrucomicrobia bacterium]|nr:MAG: hypothetical protein C5B50_12190 [Verrucomicrobiota bacterium]
MDPNELCPQARYTSWYKHGVDRKRRLAIPAQWRSESDTELMLVRWRHPVAGMFVRVFPPSHMVKIMAEIEAMPKGDPKRTILKRKIGSGSVRVPLDGNGRILLPEHMAEEAGITNEAVLVAALDVFEIWSPERRERAQISDDALEAEAYKLLE